jgi:hypothetical protein
MLFTFVGYRRHGPSLQLLALDIQTQILYLCFNKRPVIPVAIGFRSADKWSRHQRSIDDNLDHARFREREGGRERDDNTIGLHSPDEWGERDDHPRNGDPRCSLFLVFPFRGTVG